MIARLVCGALLGLLVVYPSLLTVVLTIVAAAVSQPAVLAFVLGVLARPVLSRRDRRWSP